MFYALRRFYYSCLKDTSTDYVAFGHYSQWNNSPL